MNTRPKRDKSYEQLVEEERLILAATELVYELMAEEHVTKSELASKIGRTKGYVSQLLNGERNLTLRTLAELAHALGARVGLEAQPQTERRQRVPVRSFSTAEVERSMAASSVVLDMSTYRRSAHRCRQRSHGPYEQMAEGAGSVAAGRGR